MGHHSAGLLLVVASVICLGAAQSSFYDKYCTDTERTSYFVGYPPDYSKFVWCQGSVATVLSCNPGTLFDTRFNACLASSEAQVDYNDPEDVPNYVNEFCDATKIGQQVPAIECDRYYACSGRNQAVQLTCPTGTHYSRAYGACVSPLKAGCRAKNTMCLDQFNGYQFASLQCDKYYVCDQNLMPVENSCPSGLYYNMIWQNCTTPALSNCVPLDLQIPTTPAPNGCGVPDCTTQNNGAFFPHPKCNWFYMCFNSTALEMQCECGQYYNAALKYCIQDTGNVCNAS